MKVVAQLPEPGKKSHDLDRLLVDLSRDEWQILLKIMGNPHRNQPNKMDVGPEYRPMPVKWWFGHDFGDACAPIEALLDEVERFQRLRRHRSELTSLLGIGDENA